MNFGLADKIAKTVLYEGYMLYPYQPSALKNRQPWTPGTLYPKDLSRSIRTDFPSSLQLGCAALASEASVLHVKLRFLQFTAQESESGDQKNPREATSRAREREIVCDPVALRHSVVPTCTRFSFDGNRGQPLRGEIEIAAHRFQGPLFKVSVRVENLTPQSDYESVSTVTLLPFSMASAQVMLGIENGEFLSLLDPPEEFRAGIANCRNTSVFPVLIGERGSRNMMLAAPIILYDYPQLAPESAGDFFDATEIDELLTLRVMTLSDEEKTQIRQAEPQAAEILERTEALSAPTVARLHGSIRRCEFKAGDRVRLCPRKKSDIMDRALEGQVAIVESTETDYDGKVHVAVVLENDPGREFGFQRQIAHRFFFSPEELERVAPDSTAAWHS
jgi:hypothetical protein